MCRVFLHVIHALVSGIWYKILAYNYVWDTNCWLLTIKVENYQNTELKEWIAFNVMTVWLLICLVVSTNCVVL